MNPLIPIILTPTLIDLGSQALDSLKDSFSSSKDEVDSSKDFNQYLTEAAKQDKIDLRTYLDSQGVHDLTSLEVLQSRLSKSLIECPKIKDWVVSAIQPLSLRNNGESMEVMDAQGNTLGLEANTVTAALASLTHQVNQLALMTLDNSGASIYFTASQLPSHSAEPTRLIV